MTGPGHLFRKTLGAAVLTLALSFPVFGLGAETDNAPPSFQGHQFPFTILRPVQPLPSTPLHTIKGGVTTLKRYQGKVVLLNVWATWCPACLYELPSLDKLQAEIGGDNFTVVSVSVDAGGNREALPYLKRLGIRNLPVYLDPAGRTAQALQMHEGMPWTFIIGHRGKIMGYMKGAADWGSPDGRALIRYYTRRISR